MRVGARSFGCRLRGGRRGGDFVLHLGLVVVGIDLKLDRVVRAVVVVVQRVVRREGLRWEGGEVGSRWGGHRCNQRWCKRACGTWVSPWVRHVSAACCGARRPRYPRSRKRSYCGNRCTDCNLHAGTVGRSCSRCTLPDRISCIDAASRGV